LAAALSGLRETILQMKGILAPQLAVIQPHAFSNDWE
jgi:hypothetical protein